MNKKQIRIIALGIALFFVFIGGVILSQFDRITQNESVEIAAGFPEDASTGSWFIVADVVSIDHLNGSLTLRLEFEPPKALLDENNLLTQDILLTIYGASGQSEHLFQKGKRVSSKTISIPLIGQPNDYPFDAYDASLKLGVYAPETQDGDTHYRGIPLAIDVFTNSPGYSVDVFEAIDEYTYDAGYADLVIEVQHSRAVFSFIMFLMSMQWMLALVAFVVALVIYVQKRKVAIPNFGWMWALLFAQIALRNAMPGTPPVGALGDSLSFFWVLGIIAASMLFLVILWIVRGE